MNTEQRTIPIEDFHPNAWNDNKMSPKLYEKERRSIKDFGFIDPITCRPREEGGVEIIDGEHRWRAAMEERQAGAIGLDALPAVVLLDCTDRQAKKLTIMLNRLRGQAQQEKTAAILASLAVDGTDDLVANLPYDDGEIRVLLDLAAGAWDLSKEPTPPPRVDEEWVTLKVRVPKDALGVIERALDQHSLIHINKGTKESKRGLALEAICADYVSGEGSSDKH